MTTFCIAFYESYLSTAPRDTKLHQKTVTKWRASLMKVSNLYRSAGEVLEQYALDNSGHSCTRPCPVHVGILLSSTTLCLWLFRVCYFALMPQKIFSWTQSTKYVYKEYHSVCPLVGIGTLPTPRQQLCPSPHMGGGGHTRLGEGLGEPEFRRREKKFSTLPTLWAKGTRAGGRSLGLFYVLFI